MFTPKDLQEVAFDKALFGGYDMQMVDEFLEPLTQDYITLYKENSVLKSKLKILVEKLEEYRSQESSMQKALVNAQNSAESIIAEAQRKASRILNDAESAVNGRSMDLDQEFEAEKQRVIEAREAAQRYISMVEQELHNQLITLDHLKKLTVSTVDEPQPAAPVHSTPIARIIPEPSTAAEPVFEVPAAPVAVEIPTAPVAQPEPELPEEVIPTVLSVPEESAIPVQEAAEEEPILVTEAPVEPKASDVAEVPEEEPAAPAEPIAPETPEESGQPEEEPVKTEEPKQPQPVTPVFSQQTRPQAWVATAEDNEAIRTAASNPSFVPLFTLQRREKKLPTVSAEKAVDPDIDPELAAVIGSAVQEIVSETPNSNGFHFEDLDFS